MQENNFEKSVQQKLDDFSLAPSDPVWKAVEKTLKKKKDRRLIFWLLPVLFFASVFIWWQATKQSQKTTHQTSNTKRITATPTFSKPHTEPTHTNTEEKNTVTTPRNKTGEENKIAAIEKNNQPEKSYTVGKTKNNSANKNIVGNKNIFQSNHTKPITEQTENTAAITDNYLTKIILEYQLHDFKIPIEEAVPASAKTLIMMFPNDSLKPVFQKHPNTAGWQFGIVSRGGGSNMVEKIFSGFGNKLFQSASRYDYDNPGTSVGGINTDTTARRNSSQPKAGLQFTAGIMSKKALGKKTFFITGLQYSYYSSSLSVGTQLPADSINTNANYSMLSAVLIFQNKGPQNTFTNRFHFIELPIGFKYGLLKKFPLYIQHGFVLGRLLRSNALQYDAATNSYFQKNAALQKWSFNFFTSLDFTVWKSKAVSLQAGPYLQYSLRNSFKNAATANHLFSGGLAVNMVF